MPNFLIDWLMCYFRLDELVVLDDFMFIFFCLRVFFCLGLGLLLSTQFVRLTWLDEEGGFALCAVLVVFKNLLTG